MKLSKTLLALGLVALTSSTAFAATTVSGSLHFNLPVYNNKPFFIMNPTIQGTCFAQMSVGKNKNTYELFIAPKGSKTCKLTVSGQVAQGIAPSSFFTFTQKFEVTTNGSNITTTAGSGTVTLQPGSGQNPPDLSISGDAEAKADGSVKFTVNVQ